MSIIEKMRDAEREACGGGFLSERFIWIAGVIAFIAFAVLQGQTPTPGPDVIGAKIPPIVKASDGIYFNHQDFGQWLSVVWSGATTEERWHPNWTSIVTNYKPVVHKRAHGKYEITFTSDIMKDVP